MDLRAVYESLSLIKTDSGSNTTFGGGLEFFGGGIEFLRSPNATYNLLGEISSPFTDST